MRLSLRHLFTGLGTALLLAACGGGDGGGNNTETPTSNKPVAQAGAAQTVALGATVTLDGSASKASNGNTLSYQWQFIARPEQSNASLQGATSVSPRFTPDRSGSYTVSLVVEDSTAKSDPSHVNITVTAPPGPVAILPQQINALVGTVQLDGSGSLNAQGNKDGLIYAWTLAKPSSSKATLDNAALSRPRFVADVPGVYKAVLVVSENGQYSAAAEATIDISAVNAAPVATITGPATAIRGESITLDGRGSYDPDQPNDNSHLQYRWRVEGFSLADENNTTSLITLNNANTATPSFSPEGIGTYRVFLRVYDGVASSEAALLNIQVNNRENAPLDKPVVKILPGASTETFTYRRERGDRIRLRYLPLAPGSGLLTAEWEVTSPSGQPVAVTTGYSQVFTADEVGDYRVRLRASNGQEYSDWVEAIWHVSIGQSNRRPEASAASATGSYTTGVGTAFGLSGEGSSDANNDRLSYAWVLLDRPDNSQATIQDADKSFASLTPDVPGPYLAALTVTDSSGEVSYPRPLSATGERSNEVRFHAKSRNHAPVLRPTASHPATDPKILKSEPGVHANLTAMVTANAYDPDGEAIDYLWHLLQKPTASKLSTATVGNNSDSFIVDTDVPGEYVVEVVASDGIDISAAERISIFATTRSAYPGLLLETSNFPPALGSTMPLDNSLEGQAYQTPLPFVAADVYNPVNIGTDGMNANSFRITAGDRDYTIRNLQAHSSDPAYRVRFEGLADGQRISKGTSVPFNLVLPGMDENASATFSWSFTIEENAGYTFQYTKTPVAR